jgi:TonB family protein
MEPSRKSKTIPDPATITATEPEELPSLSGAETGLPQFCLEPDPIEASRVLAWVNSICLVYLVIGALGLKPAEPVIHRRAPAALEAAPTIIEPLISTAQTDTANATPEETPSQKASVENSAAVMVTLDSPEVMFSVPTIGNLLVPLTMAPAPPPKPMESVMPISIPVSEPVKAPGIGGSLPPPPLRIEPISVTGISGNRPPPPYPEESLENGEQGRVVLLIEVDESGKITSVRVKSSSGYSRLDAATADYVRRHWIFESGNGPRKYEAPFSFHLSQ